MLVINYLQAYADVVVSEFGCARVEICRYVSTSRPGRPQEKEGREERKERRDKI